MEWFAVCCHGTAPTYWHWFSIWLDAHWLRNISGHGDHWLFWQREVLLNCFRLS
jgi:hypothetical protein